MIIKTISIDDVFHSVALGSSISLQSTNFMSTFDEKSVSENTQLSTNCCMYIYRYSSM